MDVQGCVTIPLSEYGMEGEIILSPLTFRMKTNLANALYELDEHGNQHVKKGLMPGDVAIITTLSYVKKAPFKTNLSDLEPFFDFADKADEVKPGNMDAIWARISKEVSRIESGENHPLPKSGRSPTTNSE